ncbi:MAG: TrkA family potassium uptake protein [FCB group bacterium]|nr:TrkA family potassium uptake protein [FCB group bacterium]
MKQFAIIGLGNFGAMVAKELASLKCKVTAIDTDKTKVQLLEENSQVVVILANATERKFLENLEVENFDCCVVSTGDDSHASILITLHLKELGAKRIIVKANSEEHAKILMKVGASETIIPEEEMAIKLSHSLAQPNLVDYLPLAQDYHVAELIPPEKFIDKKLLDLRLRSQYRIQVIAIKHQTSGEFNFVPGGAYKIKKDDILVVLGKKEDINNIKE